MRAAALALALAMLAAPAAADDARVLVFGSRASLLHETRGAAFSASALQQLALDAMGLGSSSRRAADGAADALPPLQADVFQQVSGYALVLAEDAAAPALVDAALDQYHGDAAYSKLFPTSKRRLTTAATALAAKATKAGSTVRCVGSAARCADVLGQETTVAAVDVDVLEKQYIENDYLNDDVEAEAAFAEELAQVAQLTDELTLQQALSPDSSTLYVVAFSDPALLGDNRIQAQEAVTTKVTAFLAALQTAHPLAGALVVPVKPIGGVASTAQQQRQLQDADEDSESDEEEEDEDEDEEDEDELDLEAESGSGSKSKAAANATSPISTQDIAEFQIVLWTSVLLGVMLLLAVVAMGNMDVGRDSLLYAKFTTGAGHRKSD